MCWDGKILFERILLDPLASIAISAQCLSRVAGTERENMDSRLNDVVMALADKIKNQRIELEDAWLRKREAAFDVHVLRRENTRLNETLRYSEMALKRQKKEIQDLKNPPGAAPKAKANAKAKAPPCAKAKAKAKSAPSVM